MGTQVPSKTETFKHCPGGIKQIICISAVAATSAVFGIVCQRFSILFNQRVKLKQQSRKTLEGQHLNERQYFNLNHFIQIKKIKS